MTFGTRLRLASALLCLSTYLLCSPMNVFAEWISPGDHVVTTVETPVKDKSAIIATLAPGTNFRAAQVQGSWVNVNQEVNGRKINGWVKRDDLLKLNQSQLAVFATRDNLTRGQFQHFKLPRSLPITVKFESDVSIDVFVISDEGLEAMKWIAKKGSGQMSSYYKQLNTRIGSFEWSPPDGDQYYLLFDNTSFPDGGVNSGRQIHHSVAICIEEPSPIEPRSGRGLIIGRATLDFDGYEGRHDRFHEHFKVLVKKVSGNDQTESLEVPVDSAGYFFIANVEPGASYSLQKIDGRNMEAPVPFSVGCSFKGKVATSGISLESAGSDELKDARKHILDLGCYSLRVEVSGKISGSVDSAEFALGYQRGEDGKYHTTVGFTSETPLDRHDWFLKKFPDSGWASMVRVHREAIIKAREEAARKKQEKEREKKRKAKEKESSKRATKPSSARAVPDLPIEAAQEPPEGDLVF